MTKKNDLVPTPQLHLQRQGQQMKCCLSAVLVFGFLGFVGCSKTLTESSAVGIAQKSVDSMDGGSRSTDAKVLTDGVGIEREGRWTAASVQRAIKEGFLVEKSRPISYPNFSGNFTGRSGNPGGQGGGSTDTLSGSVNPGAPPIYNGQFRTCIVRDPNSFFHPQDDCYSGVVSGYVNRSGEGPTAFTLTLTNVSPYGIGVEPGTKSPFQASLTRGNPDVIQVSLNGASIRLEGHVTGPDFQQNLYTYNWTGKLTKGTISYSVLKLGHLVVDSCDHLLLGTETTASAACKTHVVLTKDAKIIFGDRSTDQSVETTFGKQPDGTWVCTLVRFIPPFYDINQ